MGMITLGDVLSVAILLLVPVVLFLFIRFARCKGWIRWERLSWRDAENYTRRRAKKYR